MRPTGGKKNRSGFAPQRLELVQQKQQQPPKIRNPKHDLRIIAVSLHLPPSQFKIEVSQYCAQRKLHWISRHASLRSETSLLNNYYAERHESMQIYETVFIIGSRSKIHYH